MPILYNAWPGLVRRLQHEGPVVWLDAADGMRHGGRFSWLAARPEKIVRVCIAEEGADFWNVLQQKLYAGVWWFGWLSFEAKDTDSSVKSNQQKFTQQPEAWFMQPGFLARFDHQTSRCEILSGELPEFAPFSPEDFMLSAPMAQLNSEQYKAQIREIQHLIHEGAFYEMNFTYALTGIFEGDLLSAYLQGRTLAEVPFSVYAHGAEGPSVLCFSPERFLRKQGRLLSSEPIKGTRANIGTGNAAFNSLEASGKDRAEHVMIVDLVRNDISRVCEPGSVRVRNPFAIHSFNTVHQMISVVEGRVREGVSPVRMLEVAFPMGSMTGAPKRRVLQATSVLENWQRGLYSGSIGYITPDGDFDFNVVIRTLLVQNGRYVWGVGGAITCDSDAEAEWEETQVKTRILRELVKGRG